jgi:TonB-linked SusC/RagA family outer membrane protein
MNRKITNFLTKRFLIPILLLFCAFSIFAQNKTITGKITDSETGESLPGVNIVVAGTTIGTVTDLNGNYSINVNSGNETLEFSFIGYQKQSIALEGKSVLNVALKPELKELDEVVVVGYGTMKKSDLTGAVSSIKTEDILNTKSSNAIEALQGKIAGIDMTRVDGQAGSGFNILIRGARSLTASNAPIYIVDGVDYGSDININPNDIASMEVLKDASSTAIYGARGANGVVLITTKKGTKDKSSISFNTYFGITKPLGKIPIGDAEYFLRMTRDILRTNNPSLWNVPDNEIDVTSTLYPSEIEGYKNGTNFDWIDAQTKDYGTQQDYHLSINGGNENALYSISINNMIEDNFIPNDKYTRYSVKTNIDCKVNKYFDYGNSTYLAFIDQKRGQGINYDMNPLVSAYDTLGNIRPIPNERAPFINPLIDQDPKNKLNEIYKMSIFSTFYGQVNFSKNFNFKSSINFDLDFERNGNYTGETEYPEISRVNEASVLNANSYKWTWTNLLNFDKTIGSHHIMANIGTEAMYKRLERYYQYGRNMELKNSWWYGLRSASTDISLSEYNNPLTEWGLMSYISRLHYGLLNKYLITFVCRYDGASQLREKWDFFPAISAAWKLSDENFLKNIKVISLLKLRAGYGISGNYSVNPYSTLGSISQYTMYYEFGIPEVPAFGYRTAQLETSPKWEKTASANIGIDFGVMQNRISGSLELFKVHTYDILQKVTLPPTSAVSSVIENIGETEGKGIELSLKSIILDTKDIKWNVDLTFSRSTEKITYLADGVKQDIVNGWFVGQPLNVFYDWKKIGIWQTGEATLAARYGAVPGDIKLEDGNHDTVINDFDRVVIGTPRPKWTGGLNSTINYKNFDLSIFIYARIGQIIYDRVELMWSTDGRENSIKRDYWTPKDTTNEYPRIVPGITRSGLGKLSTLAYKNGSFVKIKDITLGYTLPYAFTNKFLISSARFYITAKNAFVFGKYFRQGRYDPEGGGEKSFPIPKLFAIGANINL